MQSIFNCTDVVENCVVNIIQNNNTAEMKIGGRMKVTSALNSLTLSLALSLSHSLKCLMLS
jgi:hypothetical protein